MLIFSVLVIKGVTCAVLLLSKVNCWKHQEILKFRPLLRALAALPAAGRGFSPLWCPAFACLRACFIKVGVTLINVSLSCAHAVPKPPRATMVFQMPFKIIFSR